MVARSSGRNSAPTMAISRGKLAPAVVKPAEDVTVAAAAHIVRHPPYVDRPGKAEHANTNGRGVRAADVAAPVPAVADDGDSAHVDVNAFRHIDIDVTECRENRHRGPSLIDRGFAQIEVKISEGTGGEGPPAQPKPPASRDMTKQGRREAGGLAARARSLWKDLGQVLLNMRQLPAEPGPQGGLDSLGELLERQA